MSFWDFLTGQSSQDQQAQQVVTQATSGSTAQQQKNQTTQAQTSDTQNLSTQQQQQTGTQTTTGATTQATTQEQKQAQTGSTATQQTQQTQSLDSATQAILQSIIGSVGGQIPNLSAITGQAGTAGASTLAGATARANDGGAGIQSIIDAAKAAATQTYQDTGLRTIKANEAYAGDTGNSFSKLSEDQGAKNLATQIANTAGQIGLQGDQQNTAARQVALQGATGIAGIDPAILQTLGAFGVPGALKGGTTTQTGQTTGQTIQDLLSSLSGTTAGTSASTANTLASITGQTTSDTQASQVAQQLSDLLNNVQSSSSVSGTTTGSQDTTTTPGLLQFITAFAPLLRPTAAK